MIWKIFARESGHVRDSQEFARECYQAGVIAVGWNPVGDLNAVPSRERLCQLLTERCGEWAENGVKTIRSWAGSLWAFRTDVKPGHYVICPDRDSEQYYVGIVRSSRVYHEKRKPRGTCHFAHRRKVDWVRILNRAELERIWPTGQFGGRQTVSAVHDGADRFLRSLKKQRRSFARGTHLPIRPDLEWGKEAESRAMAWLRARNYDPVDESHLNKGWDISCGDEKFEVKGRKSHRTAVRLTQNEWAAAKRLKKRYAVLVFTAMNREELRRAVPKQIVDPFNNPESWKKRAIYEYILVE
ncbi:MAG: DUF3883 domain-containing protein [Thermoguttaceae bacterium]